MKCKATKKFYCPVLKRYVATGEEINVDKKHIAGYLPYVEVIEKAETATKEEPKRTADKKVK
jgi:hypothetical protein